MGCLPLKFWDQGMGRTNHAYIILKNIPILEEGKQANI